MTTPIFNCTAPADNNVGNDAGVVAVADDTIIDTEGPAGEMQAALTMSGVFTDDEGPAKLLELLKTAPGILCATKAFTIGSA